MSRAANVAQNRRSISGARPPQRRNHSPQGVQNMMLLPDADFDILELTSQDHSESLSGNSSVRPYSTLLLIWRNGRRRIGLRRERSGSGRNDM